MKYLRLVLLAISAAALAVGPATAQQHGQEHKMKHHTGDHQFKDAERWSEMFDSEERDAWQKPHEVMQLMSIEPGMVVADIGAGTGYFVKHLSHAVGHSGKVHALDVEREMVEFMKERAGKENWHNVAARTVAPDEPGLKAGSVDRILIVNTWHHISDRAEYARKLAAALADGGAIYIVDLTLESKNGPPVEHRLSPEQIISELKAGGLETELLEESLTEQYIVVGRR